MSKSITVRRISVADYNTLVKAGYTIRFATPDPYDRAYSTGWRIQWSCVEPDGPRVRTHVETSTVLPYVMLKDRKRNI